MLGKEAESKSRGRRRWLVASNRLPFRWDAEHKRLESSSGGLVTAISGITSPVDLVWFGAAPEGMTEDVWTGPQKGSDHRSYYPVFFSDEKYNRYYNGMCNNVLWPLLHYESELVQFSQDVWDAYSEVNYAFAKVIADAAQDTDLIWIQDFHLFLVPAFLRELGVRKPIGLFLHTPFPSSELFRQLPVRAQVLSGILSADLVGFHDYGYLRHFGDSVRYVLGLEPAGMGVEYEGRQVQLGVFPIGIDTQQFQKEAQGDAVRGLVRKHRRNKNYQYLILGVDRLDYIKGIDLKLKAFHRMLGLYPEMQGKAVLMQLAVPSRTDIPGYVDLKRNVDQLVGAINGAYGRPHYTPVQYFFSSTPFRELIALYQLADVLLVTSKRDGMNLVALEYLVSQQPSDPGMVVLSEFTGAMSALSHVILTNPWDIEGTASNLYRALVMDRAERVARNRPMIAYLERHTASNWAESFMGALDKLGVTNVEVTGTVLGRDSASPQALEKLLTLVDGRRLTIFLDYDGTLAQIHHFPDEAILADEEKEFLERMREFPNVELVVVTGRDREFIWRQLRGYGVSFAVEHGAQFYDADTGRWRNMVKSRRDVWYATALQILEEYCTRVPGSEIEQKRYSLVWHYRRAPYEFGEFQARKLKHALDSALSRAPVHVLSGKKVIEIRAIEANKGAFVTWYLEQREESDSSLRVLAIGDDTTDEDMFAVVQANQGIAIKIGMDKSLARYRVASRRDVFPVLEQIAARSKRKDEAVNE